MGATITFTSAAVATDGTYVDVTYGNVTGTLSASSNVTNHTIKQNSVPIQYSASAVTGANTVRFTMSTPIKTTATGGSVVIDCNTSSNLTDTSANTIASGQTNKAVTNTANTNTAGTDYQFSGHTDKVTIGGLLKLTGGLYVRSTSFYPTYNSTNDNSYSFEFVADCTAVTFYGTWSAGGFKVSIDGAAPVSVSANSSTFGWQGYASGLTPGTGTSNQHLIRITFAGSGNDQLGNVRLIGGTEQIVSVARKQLYFADNISGYSAPTETSVITKWGTYSVANGVYLSTAGKNSAIGEVQVSGAVGVEVCARSGNSAGNGTYMAVSLDGAAYYIQKQNISTGGDSYFCLARDIASGSSHTLRWIDEGSRDSAGRQLCVRLYGGTRSTTTLAINDVSIILESATGIAQGDWIEIGGFDDHEVRQVTAVASNTITVAALSKAHPINCMVSPYKAAAATASTWTRNDLSAHLDVTWGDSNTEGQYGINPTYVNSWTPSTAYSYTGHRFSWAFRAFDAINHEVVNVAISGNLSGSIATAVATDLSTYVRKIADTYWYNAGTNDKNNNVANPTTFKTNLQTWATAVTGHGGIGPKYRIIYFLTPPGTNSGGFTLQDYWTKIDEVVAQYVALGYNFAAVSITGATNDGIHFDAAGQTTIATAAAAVYASATGAGRPGPLLGLSLGLGL